MSRLPVVAGDFGGWGSILNDFLSVSLNADGTLKVPASIAGNLTVTGSLTVSGTFTASQSNAQRFGSGSDFVPPTNNAWGLAVSGVIVPGISQPGYGFISAPNFTKAAEGTHSQFVNAELDFPHITNPGAGGTVTDLVAVRIGADGAPSGGTNMWAIQILNGATLFGGLDASLSSPAVGLSNNRMVSWRDAAAGYTNGMYLWGDTSNRLVVGTGNTARASWDSGGTLSLNGLLFGGLGGAAGRLVMANNAGLYWIDSAAGAANAMFALGSAGDALLLGTGNTTRISISSAGVITFVGYGTGTGAVSVGAADSGGAGFKLLRVPN